MQDKHSSTGTLGVRQAADMAPIPAAQANAPQEPAESAVSLPAEPRCISADVKSQRAREKWTHEDLLINHRLTWLLASQTLLLAAYGLLNQRLTDWFFCPTTEQLQNVAKLLEAIPYIGISLSALLFMGLVAALFAMYKIRNESKEKPDVHWMATAGGWAAGGLLPVVFGVAWLYILNHQAPVVRAARATTIVVCHPQALEQWKLDHPPVLIPSSSRKDSAKQFLEKLLR